MFLRTTHSIHSGLLRRLEFFFFLFVEIGKLDVAHAGNKETMASELATGFHDFPLPNTYYMGPKTTYSLLIRTKFTLID